MCVSCRISFLFFFFVHMGKHGCGLTVCTLHTICMVIAVDYVKRHGETPTLTLFPFGDMCRKQILEITLNLH